MHGLGPLSCMWWWCESQATPCVRALTRARALLFREQTEEVLEIAQEDLSYLAQSAEAAVEITKRDIAEFADIIRRVRGVVPCARQAPRSVAAVAVVRPHSHAPCARGACVGAQDTGDVIKQLTKDAKKLTTGEDGADDSGTEAGDVLIDPADPRWKALQNGATRGRVDRCARCRRSVCSQCHSVLTASRACLPASSRCRDRCPCAVFARRG